MRFINAFEDSNARSLERKGINSVLITSDFNGLFGNLKSFVMSFFPESDSANQTSENSHDLVSSQLNYLRLNFLQFMCLTWLKYIRVNDRLFQRLTLFGMSMRLHPQTEEEKDFTKQFIFCLEGSSDICDENYVMSVFSFNTKNTDLG